MSAGDILLTSQGGFKSISTSPPSKVGEHITPARALLQRQTHHSAIRTVSRILERASTRTSNMDILLPAAMHEERTVRGRTACSGNVERVVCRTLHLHLPWSSSASLPRTATTNSVLAAGMAAREPADNGRLLEFRPAILRDAGKATTSAAAARGSAAQFSGTAPHLDAECGAVVESADCRCLAGTSPHCSGIFGWWILANTTRRRGELRGFKCPLRVGVCCH